MSLKKVEEPALSEEELQLLDISFPVTHQERVASLRKLDHAFVEFECVFRDFRVRACFGPLLEGLQPLHGRLRKLNLNSSRVFHPSGLLK